jgi:NAD(P)-dependent dehydrogenase (short-subunit alcohol dehydrogenase family)
MTAPLSLKGKTALVTGASRGIGRAIAEKLLESGAHVILVARAKKLLEELDDYATKVGSSSSIAVVDLSNMDLIPELCRQVMERVKTLDILIGNAAILGGLGPVTHYSLDTWRRVFDLNLHANWLLLKHLEPSLKASPKGNVIMVTSGVTQGIFPYWSAYAASKAALETMLRTYAEEMGNISGMNVRLFDPGVVATDMRAQAFPGENPERLKSPQAAAEEILKLVKI